MFRTALTQVKLFKFLDTLQMSAYTEETEDCAFYSKFNYLDILIIDGLPIPLMNDFVTLSCHAIQSKSECISIYRPYRGECNKSIAYYFSLSIEVFAQCQCFGKLPKAKQTSVGHSRMQRLSVQAETVNNNRAHLLAVWHFVKSLRDTQDRLPFLLNYRFGGLFGILAFDRKPFKQNILFWCSIDQPARRGEMRIRLSHLNRKVQFLISQ